MWTLAIILLWGVSFATFPLFANGFWTPKTAIWIVGSFSLASSSWWNAPTNPGVFNRSLGWFFVWAMVSFGWFVLWPQISTPQTTEMQVQVRWYVSPILPTLSLLGSLLALDALIRHTDTIERWHTIALHIVRIGTVMACWAIAQTLWLDPLQLGPRSGTMNLTQNSPITALGNQTLTGNFLALCAPLSLMFRTWRYRFGAFLVMVMAIGLTRSASSLIAVWLASCLVWYLQRRRLASLLMLGLGLLAAGIASWYGILEAFLNPQGRWEMWQTAWQFWLKQPLNAWIGYGAGSVEALTYHGIWKYGYLHNEWLQIALDYGLIGLGLAGMACLAGWKQLWRMPMDAAAAAWCGAACSYGLIACVSFPLRIGSTLMLGVFIIAALYAHAGKPEEVRYG